VRILLSTCAVLLLAAAPVAAAPPSPDFTYSPTTPTVGQPVTFTPTTTRAARGATAHWDFQDDNVPDVRNVPALQAVTYSFPAAGTFSVRMWVRNDHDDDEDDEDDDDDDEEDVISVVKPIRVTAPPDTRFYVNPTAPVLGEDVIRQSLSSSAGFSLMSPFPVVRLAGSLYPRGVKVRALEARAPAQSTVTVRCAGKSCPSKRIVKKADKSRVRFKAMTRFLREGTIISVSVRKGALIGKYTRWLIRGGKLPKRKDLCLYPRRSKPARCPLT
jgi:hypothetical protein